jgi:molybdenum cofactor cytidylyltransferase
MITCVLLSAGLSERFGSPKALAKLNDETVIEHIQNMLAGTQVNEIIIVLGAYAGQIKPHLLNHKKVKFVYNKDYNFGQTSSFKAGLANVSNDARGIMLLPVDHPLVSADTVNALIRYFLDKDPLILIPTFKGKKGHPPLFSVKLRDEFLSLKNESGLNAIARAHPSETVELPLEDIGVISAFNTLGELESIKNLN